MNILYCYIRIHCSVCSLNESQKADVAPGENEFDTLHYCTGRAFKLPRPS